MIALLWQLFATFFVIGLFNFGGGGAMLSLIQAQVVTEHGWLTEKAFTDIVAISQSTPGPIGINCATYVGFQVLHDEGYSNLVSILGSASTTLAIVLPSFLVFFVIIRIFNKFHQHPVFASVMGALRPAVAGMIGAAALVLILGISWSGSTVSILCYTKKAGPITLLVTSGVIGLLIY